MKGPPQPAPRTNNLPPPNYPAAATQQQSNANWIEEAINSFEFRDTVTRMMTRVLPPSVAIDPAASDLVLDCMLEFASSLSHEAVVKAAQDGEHKIVGKHFEHAVRVLGYEDYVAPIAAFNAKRDGHVQGGCTSCAGRIEPLTRKYTRKAPNTAASSSVKGQNTAAIATAAVPTASAANTDLPASSSSSSSSATMPATTIAAPPAAPKPSKEKDAEAKKDRRKRIDTWEQLDAEKMVIFAQRLGEAVLKDNPLDDLRSLSKDLNISMKVLKEKLEQLRAERRKAIVAAAQNNPGHYNTCYIINV